MLFLRSKYQILMLFICTQVFSQNSSFSPFHPFSDKVILSIEGGFTHSYTDLNYASPQPIGRGSIEYFFTSRSSHSFGLKLSGGISKVSGSVRQIENEIFNDDFETDLFFLGTGFSYGRTIGYAVLHFSATISHLRINPMDSKGNLLINNFNRKYNLNNVMYTIESGIKFIMDKNWSVNLGINYNFTNTDFIDDWKLSKDNDGFASLFFGISFYHGGDNDSDGDGIIDSKDSCPETMSGVKVDPFGCPEDSDKDGIPDYEDKCPNTPRNILIDNYGCPIDSDRDGIPDYLDKCPDSDSEVIVDSSGCPKIEINTAEIISKIDTVETTEEIRADVSEIIEIGAEDTLLYDYKNEKMLKDLFFTDGALFCFQVGAFKKIDEAEGEYKKLTKNGHNALIIKADPFENDEVWYRVRIGYFNTLEAAKDYKVKMREK